MSDIDTSKMPRRKIDGVWIAEVPEVVLKELLERSSNYDNLSLENKRCRDLFIELKRLDEPEFDEFFKRYDEIVDRALEGAD